MGYINPLLRLPAGKALLTLPAADRARIERVLRELRAQADAEAEIAWRRRKAPMAAYWRAVSTYARHLAHAVSTPRPARRGAGLEAMRGGAMVKAPPARDTR
ncbi:hypothetical protein [Xanthomonas hortorum]|uniref:Uncharacterized protein n=1 Tax=Xanthomonas hortorum pv. hederae TaxID=453603 RepID=A0A9X4H6Y9_9XANT|nr:hypothetical protein [Xanthomonas hortorum]MCE4369712.1 hypothetical protein [Xanthomonas hortorum pv. hederae]MDC8640225.1 hypothetical protein [Xanthomonas hortorum pv. hederae]